MTMVPTGWVGLAILGLSGLLKSDSENDVLGNGQESPASSHALGTEGNCQRVIHLDRKRETEVGEDAVGEGVRGAW